MTSDAAQGRHVGVRVMNGTVGRRVALRLPIAAVLAVVSPLARADVLFVDDDNCPGPGDGSELNPYCSIQAAIDNAVDGDEIVVAPGTHLGSINFDGKAITLRSSGGPESTIIDSVVGAALSCTSGEGADTVLEGFTVTTSFPGMHLIESGPTVRNCTFSGNSFGMLLQNGSNPFVTSCRFQANFGSLGAAMRIHDSSPIVVNCVFLSNTSVLGFGGAVSIDRGSPTFANCVFAGNLADCLAGCGSQGSQGGAIAVVGGTPLVANCIFFGNTACGPHGCEPSEGGAISGSASVVNCAFWNNSPDQDFPDSILVDPMFVDPDDGDFRLLPQSPCIDAGDNAAVPAAITTDLDGNLRFLDVPEMPDTGDGDPPVVDMGAYESLGGGCLALTGQEVVCHPDGSTFTLNVEGVSACLGDPVTATFTGSGGAVGKDLCFTMMVNGDQGGFCCSTEVCVAIPDCSEALADLDGDGIVGVLDLLMLLGQLGACPGGCWSDLDRDGTVGVGDLLILLGNWD